MPRLLEKILGHLEPDRPVEVVNAAMTAISSAVIVDIARDLQALRPDVVVVYMGNNEVIGPYGPGTVFTAWPGAVRLAALRARLTRLRLAQLLRRPRRPGARSWEGLDLFAHIHFPENDPRLEPMYDAFRRNLESILLAGRRSGARVLLATVAVNLADCPPFGSEEPDILPPADRDAWTAAFQSGRTAQERGDAAAAREAFLVAQGLFDRHAGLIYHLAQAEEALGRPEAAQTLFQRARDLDTRRFRTDSRLNRLIRDVAREQGVELVDAEAAFDEAARGAPGEEFFLDHVHFTFAGTRLLAGRLAAAIQGPDAPAVPDENTCRRLMFFTPWAERQQAAAMADRRRRPPFRDQPGNTRQLARLYTTEARCTALIARTPLDTVEREYRELAASSPRDFFVPFQWGSILAANGRWAEAAPLLTQALKQVPFHFEARVLPALALAHAGQPEEAAGVVTGPPGPCGRYLAENALAVMRGLEADGLVENARRFRAELLRRTPRFPLRQAIETYPLGHGPGTGDRAQGRQGRPAR